MKPDEIQPIVDYAYPKIQKYYGKGKLPVPPIKLSVDIYARLSGEPEARGEESETSEAQYEEKDNIIAYIIIAAYVMGFIAAIKDYNG